MCHVAVYLYQCYKEQPTVYISTFPHGVQDIMAQLFTTVLGIDL